MFSRMPCSVIFTLRYNKNSYNWEFKLDRGGVQYDPTRTSHSIGGLRQRKNKHGAETHVFVLAGAGKFSTIMD